MSEMIPAAPRGPATYDRLKMLRSSYALIVLGVLAASCCLSVAAQMMGGRIYASFPVEYQNSGAYQELPRAQDVFAPVIVIVFALSALGCAIVTGIFAGKVGMPYPMVPAVLAPWPFLQWVAFFMVVGYTPDHLKKFEPAENPPPAAAWLSLAFLPLLLMGFLGVINPQYMAQLFSGPPVGAYMPNVASLLYGLPVEAPVPTLPIPCGWPILGMIFLGVVLPNIALWFGFQKGLVRGWWKLLLAVLILIHFTFPSAWLVLLGPAAVQVYKQFFGS